MSKFSKQPPTNASSSVVLPPGACDSHGHIFPTVEPGPSAMPETPVEFFVDIHRQLGFERGVLVQGGAYKFDNSAMVAALRQHRDTLRGVALVPGSVTQAELEQLVADGVSALRFTKAGASSIDNVALLAPAMRSLDLHAEIYLGLEGFLERADELLALGLPIVLDHMAAPFDTADGVDGEEFQALLKLLAHDQLWVKLTPQRSSKQFPDYGDARAFHDAIVAAAPDRLVWGSDWPFPNMGDVTPEIGHLLDLFGSWISDTRLKQAILVDNPARLYGFPPL